ncbi:MAG: dihydrodipicolinate synthase family protein [Acidobacteria bacterium]|nr:dihydrodipicolinate synthase family protein [Acidobacteriota bacterium]
MSWEDKVRNGCVVPAHPLALNAQRKLDERRQRALTRYYLAAGSGGLAVAVHTTQFEIRDPHIGLLEPVLALAAEEMNGHDVVKVAGVVGRTPQAVREATLAAGLGYHAGLLSLSALKDASVPELLAHVRAVAEVIPVFGFYLQPAVGGRVLPYAFWRQFAEIENVVGIKMAPFNRYQTLDVVRAVADSGSSLALYTGNDDNIIADLLTTFRLNGRELRIVGGLLGHWAVWTRRAVEQLDRIHAATSGGSPLDAEWLTLGVEVTDSNAAFFDPGHGFHGCIPGVHEVLRRQGLLEGRWCLNPHEELSPGQMEEIDRVYAAYPHLNDDAFVREHLDTWLS